MAALIAKEHSVLPPQLQPQPFLPTVLVTATTLDTINPTAAGAAAENMKCSAVVSGDYNRLGLYEAAPCSAEP